MIKKYTDIANEQFPELMLTTKWNDESAQVLVRKYLEWQAPLLLTLTYIKDATSNTLEINAQKRTNIVVKYCMFYPKVINTMLINKILVEARMRDSLS